MPSQNAIHVAIELSFSSWLVGVRLAGTEKPRLHRVEGGNTTALLTLIAEQRSHARPSSAGARTSSAASRQVGMGSGCIDC